MSKVKFLYLYLSRLLARYWGRLRSFKKSEDKVRMPATRSDILPHKTTSVRSDFNWLGLFILAIFLGLSAYAMYPHIIGGYTVSEGVVGAYTPENLPTPITNLLSAPLTVMNKNGVAQPNLVVNWQANKDLTEYTFKLKDNLYWNDGSKLKSSDIIFNLPDITVSYPDNKTIDFKLADSFSPFPSLLTNPTFKGNSLIGLGKYKVFQEETENNFITKLVLVPVNRKDNLPMVTFRFYQDDTTALTAFNLGEVSSVIGLNNLVDTSSEQARVKNINNYTKIRTILYNVADPVLSDDNFRKALNLATPKFSGEQRAITSIPPFFWAYNSDMKDNLGQIDEAKKYFDKVESGKDQAIVLTTNQNIAPLAQQIVDSWKKVGINASVKVESGVPQIFQALLIDEQIPIDPDQYSLWHSTQTKLNLSKLPLAARIDKDLEDGRKIADLDQRKEKYQDFQKVMAEIVPATFLYFPQIQVIYRPKVENALNQVLPLEYPFYY